MGLPTKEAQVSENKGWVGVDLDGTLAKYTGQLYDVGEPIPGMVERVKQMIADGKDVRIMTARVAPVPGKFGFGGDLAFIAAQQRLISLWCQQNLGKVLPITASKDFQMVELWDDLARRVIYNTGVVCSGCQEQASK